MTTLDEYRAALAARRIECPIPWCEGRWTEHGAGGEPADEWRHTGQGVDIAQGWAVPVQVGSGAPLWAVGFEWHAELHPEQLSEIANQLRGFADAIEAKAGEAL